LSSGFFPAGPVPVLPLWPSSAAARGGSCSADHFLHEAKIRTDNQSGVNDRLSPTLIDPEAYDASEQTFAASLERTV